MDTISLIDDDPTLPIDFDQSTNFLNFLQKDRMDSTRSGRESLLSQEESSSEAGNNIIPQINGQNTPERGTIREHEEIISTFKKENFGLKLRIYFLEERLQMAYEEDTEDVLKTNIELKVNIEQLKKELTEKQQLLIKASKAMETITTESEKHINKLKEEFTKQYDDMVNDLQEEIKNRDSVLLAKEKVLEDLNEKFTKADEAKKELENNLQALNVNPKIVEDLISKQQEMKEKHEAEIQEKDLKIKELEERKSKEDAKIELKELQDQIEEKENKIQSLKDELREIASQSPDRTNHHYEVLYNKMEAQNSENENKIKELTKDLKKKTNLVEELKDYINKTERVNKELRNSIHDKETEKHRSSTSLQEHIRWKLNNRLRDLLASVRLDLALTNKEKEVNRCHAQIERLEKVNEELQTEISRNQNDNELENKHSQEKLEAIAALKADLQEKEILFKKFKQVIEDKDKELMYFNNAKLKAEEDLENGIAQKNLEVQGITEQLNKLAQSNKEKLKLLEDQCQKVQEDAQLQLNNKDKLIQRLTNAIRSKDILIEELIAPQGSFDAESEPLQDVASMAHVIKKLRAKLKDMDQTLEANLDEKFKSIDEKDKDILELKRNVRDKDHEMELLKANVIACEGVIKHLENISEEKDKTMHDLKNALEIQESSFKVSIDAAAKELEDCQMNVLKLSRLLDVKEGEINEMQKNFLKNSASLEESNLKAIHDQLDARHKLNQELASERDAAVHRNEINKQKFISALNSKDAQIRDAFTRMGRLAEEKNEAIKNLKALVEQKNENIKDLENKFSESESKKEASTLHHQNTEIEKDHAIENLTKSGVEKDRIISELQERLNLLPKGGSDTTSNEMGTLKEDLRKAMEDLQRKNDEISGLNLDNKHLQQKLNDLKKSENIEITMKFDDLRSELDDKERKLKDAREDVREIRWEMKQAASLAESLQKKIHTLEEENDGQIAEIEELKRQCMKKDASIKEMQKEVNDSRDLTETLNKLKEQKDKLEERLNALHAEAEMLKSKKEALEGKNRESDLAVVGLERKLEENNNKIESMVHVIDDLKRENNELKSEIERGLQIPQRNDEPVGAGIDEIDSKELRDLLKTQLEEQKKLFEATEKERAQYNKLIEELQNNSQPNQDSNLQLELQSINTLKLQYEESVRQNETLQHRLENEIKLLRESTLQSSKNHPSSQTEIDNLKRKLEESENWNKSLQSRLDQLLPRAGGVGAAVDTVDGGHTKKDYDVLAEDCLNLKKTTDSLRQQLDEKSRDLKEKSIEIEEKSREIQEKSKELMDITKTLTDLKVHYDKFAQLRNKEIETLTINCEQAKRVIKELEEKVRSLDKELQGLKEAKGKDSFDLMKQIESINGLNDVLRKTLNEKIEELKQANDKVLNQEEQFRKMEKKFRSLSDDRSLLMNQMQEKVGQMNEVKKEVENLRFESDRIKEDRLKKIRECESLLKDRQELRNLNERLRKTLGDVSKTYENLKEANEQGMSNMKEELQLAEAKIQQQNHENEEANSVNMKLRDEIRSLQKSSRELQRLATELAESQNVNRVLQRQLNELVESGEMKKNALEPEIDRLKRRVGELLKANNEVEEKLRFYERQAAALQEEYRHEQHAFENEKEALQNDMETLKQEIKDLNEVKVDMESRFKQLFYESESYKSMIERLENDNMAKKNALERLTSQLNRQRDLIDHSTTTTPPKRSSMPSQTTPNRLAAELENMASRENSLKDALQKRDIYIEALRKQIEFYKEEKSKADMERREKEEKSEEDVSGKDTHSNLIALHISEMRELRRELEQSILNNNALRDHLEHRLSEAEKEAEKLKDPNVRVSLLRENDSLRAKLAEHDLKMKELQMQNQRLQQDGQRSSGLVLEKNDQIKQLKMRLEKRNVEYERMQTFVPQETSSCVTSPLLDSISNFTQTTPRKQTLMLHKDIQVDTILAKSVAEKQQFAERLKQSENALRKKDVLLKEMEQEKEKQKDEAFRTVVNLKSEIVELRTSLESTELYSRKREVKIKELEDELSRRNADVIKDKDEKSADDDLIALHIAEMQKLKRELELSLRNNEELKSQLEHRLSMIEKDAEKLKDPKLRPNIIRDNDMLRTQSIERKNAVARLQGVIDQLNAEKKSDKECIKKLHQEIHNLNKVATNLKEEVTLYDRLQQQLGETAARNQAKSNSPESAMNSKDGESMPKFDASLLQILLEEIRNLRVQLQKSIDTNIALKERLEEQLGASFHASGFSSPANTAVDSKTEFDDAKGNSVRRVLFSSFGANAVDLPGNEGRQFLTQETPTKENGSPGSRSYFLSPNSLAVILNEASNKNMFVRGKLEDFVLLKNKLTTCIQRVIVMQDIQLILQKQRLISGNQMNELKAEVDRISFDLSECRRLVNLMWVDDVTKHDDTSNGSTILENQQLKTEVANLKKRLLSQEKLIKTSLQRLEESNKIKENLEHQILEKLKTTRGTMIKASQNLEDKIVKSKTPPKQSR